MDAIKIPWLRSSTERQLQKEFKVYQFRPQPGLWNISLFTSTKYKISKYIVFRIPSGIQRKSKNGGREGDSFRIIFNQLPSLWKKMISYFLLCLTFLRLQSPVGKQCSMLLNCDDYITLILTYFIALPLFLWIAFLLYLSRDSLLNISWIKR